MTGRNPEYVIKKLKMKNSRDLEIESLNAKHNYLDFLSGIKVAVEYQKTDKKKKLTPEQKRKREETMKQIENNKKGIVEK